MIETNKYITEDFLLIDDLSRSLYHDFAENLPIIDFHNHLNPVMIANDMQAENLSQLWVMPDQYKHRAMRINGIHEAGITGDASDYEKYLNWTRTLPMTLGNPLHQWSYLELKRIFDVDSIVNESSANEIWEHCNLKIASGQISTVSVLKQYQVEALCTSDDLLDDVSVHIAASKQGVIVLPSLRTDSLMDQSESFRPWCDKLEHQTKIKIKDLDSYEEAVQLRFDVFDQAGCSLADQALDSGFEFHSIDKSKANNLFKKLLSGNQLSEHEAISLRSHLLVMVGKACAQRRWGLQLHIGAHRKTNTRFGKNPNIWGGFAAVGQSTEISALASFLDSMDMVEQMPRIILYNHNPVDNAAFASLAGSFAEDGVAGKIQLGPPWWYNDHYEGIQNQLSAVSNHGLLHHSIGMTTDSRSFLSMSRHEYYRRVFCQFISDWVKKGLFPGDLLMLKELVEAVCYKNAKNWILNKHTKK